MPLEWLMRYLSNLRPKAAHILVVERDDGHTMLDATFNVKGRLALLNGGGCLTHCWMAIDSPYAEEIVAQVAHELRPFAKDGFGPWYAADYQKVARLVGDYNPTTGARYRDMRFEVGGRVSVAGAGKGTLTGFRGPMLVVKLDKPCGHANSVIASRAIVKPVLRASLGGMEAA